MNKYYFLNLYKKETGKSAIKDLGSGTKILTQDYLDWLKERNK